MSARWVALYDTTGQEFTASSLGLVDEDSQRQGLYTIYTTNTFSLQQTPSLDPQVVPCYRIWDADGNSVSAVVVCRST